MSGLFPYTQADLKHQRVVWLARSRRSRGLVLHHTENRNYYSGVIILGAGEQLAHLKEKGNIT